MSGAKGRIAPHFLDEGSPSELRNSIEIDEVMILSRGIPTIGIGPILGLKEKSSCGVTIERENFSASLLPQLCDFLLLVDALVLRMCSDICKIAPRRGDRLHEGVKGLVTVLLLSFGVLIHSMGNRGNPFSDSF